jgi:FkbM family methyltransferase
VARGWRGILVEPHPAPFAQLQKLHRRRPRVTCHNVACSNFTGTFPLFLGNDPSTSTLSHDPELLKTRTQSTIQVKVETLSDLLNTLSIPADIGLLTVDSEGMDYEVLVGLDFSRWRPRLIITEDCKAKEAKKSEWLISHGYRLVMPIAENTIWQSTR